ncbi:MAG TPA: hypothetical protein VFQ48_02460 [Pseudonocardiaceae bacterium]|nr:hypothetical protein [Pseudonocardiaceae bacterium]
MGDDQPAAVDPATLAPLCSEAEFTEEMGELVADEAPRLFAVVQEYGTRVDGRIAAWGMAFEDHAEVVAVNGGLRLSLGSPERATRLFARRPSITATVVWVTPEVR